MEIFTPPTDAMAEQGAAIREFTDLLSSIMGDGGNKRALGQKPHWTVDPSHRKALFSHLVRWTEKETQDPDSGKHPLIHLAWRALAIAWQETHGSMTSASLTNGEESQSACSDSVGFSITSGDSAAILRH